MRKLHNEASAAMLDDKWIELGEFPAGACTAVTDTQADKPKKWGKVDEVVNEGFAANDASAKY